jgi:hypothetical protein
MFGDCFQARRGINNLGGQLIRAGDDSIHFRQNFQQFGGAIGSPHAVRRHLAPARFQLG